jgi:hypothetical protein
MGMRGVVASGVVASGVVASGVVAHSKRVLGLVDNATAGGAMNVVILGAAKLVHGGLRVGL